MKYMKLGTKPDTFYTIEATRSVMSDVPADLIIQINNTRYLLHKFPLLLKCGLLQRLCSDSDTASDAGPCSIPLHNVPGGEAAFELCAKFCYGISITLSAHNFVPTISAATFLLMTESVSRGNLLSKLETFFNTCILQGWKDAIATLQAAAQAPPGWSDNRWIIQPCLQSVVEKILAPLSDVTWSFTYTRPGYSSRSHRSIPKDWWTEDISDLDLNLFHSVISAIKSVKTIPPALIGEALHVYACKHLPEQRNLLAAADHVTTADEATATHRRVLEAIVSMIPSMIPVEHGAVSGGFLLRLLKVANAVGASPSVKAELVRRSGLQLDEARPVDLIFPLSTNPQSYDVGVVEAILENFLMQFRRRPAIQEENERMVRAMARVARTFDSYLQVVAHDAHLPVTKFVELAESLPEIARQDHDRLYQAINIYLKEHPELSKSEKKRICQVIDCRKLSPDTRSHAIANDQLPLRMIVQLLFIEQERTGRTSGGQAPLDRPSIQTSTSGVTNEEAGKSRQPERQGHQQREEPMEDGRNNRVRLGTEAKVSRKVEGSGCMPKPKLRGEPKEEKRIATTPPI